MSLNPVTSTPDIEPDGGGTKIGLIALDLPVGDGDSDHRD